MLMGCESGFLLAVIILSGKTMGKLRIWNGIGDDGDPDGHLFVFHTTQWRPCVPTIQGRYNKLANHWCRCNTVHLVFRRVQT